MRGDHGAVGSALAGSPAATTNRGVFVAVVTALRPRQWIKNGVIFSALIFSHTLVEPLHLLRSAAAFMLFCAASSAVYILNDILDLKNDRVHPVKSRRPIAAGDITVSLAATVAAILGGGSLVRSW